MRNEEQLAAGNLHIRKGVRKGKAWWMPIHCNALQ
jgi:hypothetical protein